MPRTLNLNLGAMLHQQRVIQGVHGAWEHTEVKAAGDMRVREGETAGLKKTELEIHVLYSSFLLWFSRWTDLRSFQRTVPTLGHTYP